MTKSYNSLHSAYNDITESEKQKKRDRIVYIVMGVFLIVIFIIGIMG